MSKSTTSLIKHIPLFLDYCKEIGLSEKTHENYKHCLNKFILWLKEKGKESLLPHKLTNEDISAYISYLTQFKDQKGRSLKVITQNYYLIALRALLGYFTAKDIVSLPVDKIRLPKATKAEKTVKFLNLDQIQHLLLAPNVKTQKGLRDRAILETLISTGLKVNQLRKLDRNQLKDIPREISPLLEKYLQTRRDKNNALFINYKARRDSIGGRLTARSIERIVNYYGKKANLPFFITPEILRWARAYVLLDKEIIITEPQNHKVFVIKNYSNNKESIKSSFSDKKDISPAWHVVENFINKEIDWLKDNIPTMPERYKENPPFFKHDDSIFRKIAILIVSNEAKATEFRSENENKDLWNNLTEKKNINRINRHGQEWHKKMMDVTHEYFKLRNYEITLEPVLNYGRADLGIGSNSHNPLYIEVGTVSLFKLWYNLSTMKNVTFLIIPSENKAIEFNA
jgi:integrase/recombinase XerD